MNALQAMSQEAKRLGCKAGENAKQWHDRDPKAAKEFAEWIKSNMKSVTKAIAKSI